MSSSPDPAAVPLQPQAGAHRMETKVLNSRTKIERRAEPPTYRQQVTKAMKNLDVAKR